MEKLGTNKLNMQKLLAPAALVILYIVFSIFGNNFLSLIWSKTYSNQLLHRLYGIRGHLRHHHRAE